MSDTNIPEFSEEKSSDREIDGPKTSASSYGRAGIENLEDFYATKFLSTEILTARYFRPLDRFDMHFARTLWVYDNVREGSTLLDIGCGVGMLALLKRKNVELSGVDISDECVAAAKRNGYSDVRRGELTNLPFADAAFDYVASLDVIGHIAFEEKDQLLAEIKRVLKPNGVTLHGIECTDSFTHKSYDEMSEKELRHFAAIDGHIGLERAAEHAARFGKFFEHVAFEPRYALCLSSEEFLKQADAYDLPYETDFLDYLRGLSHRERRAFDMAMGYVFNKISDLHIKLPESGLYTFLKASNVKLGAFYNEHRDRLNLFSKVYFKKTSRPDFNEESLSGAATESLVGQRTESFSLDFAPGDAAPIPAEFDDGWHAPDDLPPVARWMRERACVKFRAQSVSFLRLDLTTHMPELGAKRPVELRFLLNGVQLTAFSLYHYGWLELKLDVPEALRRAPQDVYDLTIYADKTFQPRPGDAENRDDRELSIAVCNIQVCSER